MSATCKHLNFISETNSIVYYNLLSITNYDSSTPEELNYFLQGVLDMLSLLIFKYRPI